MTRDTDQGGPFFRLARCVLDGPPKWKDMGPDELRKKGRELQMYSIPLEDNIEELDAVAAMFAAADVWEAKERLLDEVNARLRRLEPKLDRIQRNTDAIIKQRDALRKQLEGAERKHASVLGALNQAMLENDALRKRLEAMEGTKALLARYISTTDAYSHMHPSMVLAWFEEEAALAREEDQDMLTTAGRMLDGATAQVEDLRKQLREACRLLAGCLSVLENKQAQAHGFRGGDEVAGWIKTFLSRRLQPTLAASKEPYEKS